MSFSQVFKSRTLFSEGILVVFCAEEQIPYRKKLLHVAHCFAVTIEKETLKFQSKTYQTTFHISSVMSSKSSND